MHEDIPSFTPQQLDSIASVSIGAIPRIVEIFVLTGRDRVTSLLGALEVGDWGKVSALAHSLRGSSGSVGAERLARIAAAIETHANGVAPMMTPEIEAHRAELDPEFERARASAEAYVQALGA
jgi:HPt (histidine-containing phosphotransfer) domain-containing protein